jgi:two-component system, sensor histidine kinase LadS
MAPASTALGTTSPENAVVTRTEVFVEAGPEQTFAEAKALQAAGHFKETRSSRLSFGIGARPVWVHIELLNAGQTLLPVNLVTSASWTDRLEGYLAGPGKSQVPLVHWQTGDEVSHAHDLVPAIGYTQRLLLEPGAHHLYLRASARDALVLPLELVSDTKFRLYEREVHYSYGFLYGFLVAMVFYYSLIFARLRERSYLYYVGYLASLMLCNVAYTGHGFALLWPMARVFQRYVILVLMICGSSSGLLFAAHFLELDVHSPRVARALRRGVFSGMAAMALCLIVGSHAGAGYVAFTYTFLFAVAMVPLGLLSLRFRRRMGYQFLTAAVCGSLGTAATTLSVWGVLPYSRLLYRGLEIGVILEAILWGFALASRIRDQQVATVEATEVSLTDPLTSLRNRRGFLNQVAPVWERTVRLQRPLTIVMIDIDHFKRVNDEYGHAIGDTALVAVAEMLLATCRSADVLARWGGEEFILLLPDTNQQQARIFAERARATIEANGLPIPHAASWLALTASFGLAQRGSEASISELIEQADKHLYEAKKNGRNRISDNGAIAEPSTRSVQATP